MQHYTEITSIKSRIIMLIMLSLFVTVSCMAKYTLYKYSGDIKVMRRNTELPISKDMELRSNDRISIPEGGEVQILNSFDKSISISGKPGISDVLSIIINAANDNPGVVTGNSKKTGEKVDFVNAIGGTTRGDFDPYLNNADCHMLGAALMNMIEGKCTKEDTPVAVDYINENGICKYEISNTESFPLYFNVLTWEGDSLVTSPLGQEISCYVLHPGHGIMRKTLLNDAKSHFIVMSPCYFNVSELLGCIRENELSPLGRPEALPQSTLPVYIHNLK